MVKQFAAPPDARPCGRQWEAHFQDAVEFYHESSGLGTGKFVTEIIIPSQYDS